MRRIDALKLALGGAGLALMLVACHPASKADDGAAMFQDDHGLLTVPAASPLRSHLTVAPVSSGGETTALELPATVEADPARVANVLAPLTGRVIALKVALGQPVKKGQVLAILASGDFDQALSDEAKAKDQLDLTDKALKRAQGVQEAGGAAVKDLESAQSAYAQARSEFTRAHARLASLNGVEGGRNLTLTAPQDGVLTTLAVAEGAQVSDPTAVLMTVTNLSQVFVTANVAEADIGKVRLGAAADIVLSSDPTKTLHGRISEVDAVVASDTRRQKVRIAVPDSDGRLLPNMYATVRVTAPALAAVYVPQSALLMNNDATSVLVEVRPWAFQRRAVKIGDETDAAARVLSGLSAGDRVVVRGGVLLDD